MHSNKEGSTDDDEQNATIIECSEIAKLHERIEDLQLSYENSEKEKTKLQQLLKIQENAAASSPSNSSASHSVTTAANTSAPLPSHMSYALAATNSAGYYSNPTSTGKPFYLPNTNMPMYAPALKSTQTYFQASTPIFSPMLASTTHSSPSQFNTASPMYSTVQADVGQNFPSHLHINPQSRSMPALETQIPAMHTQGAMPTYTAHSHHNIQPLLPPSMASQAMEFPLSNTHSQTLFNNALPPPTVYNHAIRKLQDLPQFSGLPEQWPMFAVACKETTEAYSYTNLAQAQTNKAQVEAFLIHPDSVNAIMSTLEFHFGRPQILIRSQISKVRAYPTIASTRLSEIVNFSSMVSNLTVFLQNAGATPHLNNPTLLDELVSKLPLFKREEWAKHIHLNMIQYPSVCDFSAWLQQAAMYVSMAIEIEHACKGHSPQEFGKKPERTSKSAFTITQEPERKLACLICDEKHYLNQCATFRNCLVPERWEIVKKNKLCFACLRPGHNAMKCISRRECGLASCHKFHNRLLHENYVNKETKLSKYPTQQTSNYGAARDVKTKDGNLSITNQSTNSDNADVITIVNNNENKRTLFKFLSVELKGSKGCCKIMAFIDDGSKISLIEEKVAKSIGLKGTSDMLTLRWIGGTTTTEMSHKLNFEISGLEDKSKVFQMRGVRTTQNLQLPSQSLQLSKFKRNYAALKNIYIEDYDDAVPQLLIGMPHINLVRPLDVKNLDDSFAVHRTILGSVLFGSNEEATEALVCRIDYDQIKINEIEKQIAEYFTIENFEMKPLEPLVSEHDKRAEQILFNCFEFQESYSAALKRLEKIEDKMKKDEEFADWYKGKIDEYVDKSYARKLSQDEARMLERHTWYLQHFAVRNINKGNKLRLVFDAAASTNNVSLNSRLMKGPNKYQPKPLLAILFKFRQAKIGLCADIREMFHRINIREADQTAQRFVWRDGDPSKPPDIYSMSAMIFGSACSPCSAQYIKNKNAEIFRKNHPRAVEAIIERHYVDDYVDCFDTNEEAIQVANKVINIHRQAGFELRSFASNSTEFCDAVIGKSTSPDSALENMCHTESETEKILGMFWQPSTDLFCFVLKFARVPKAVLNGDRRPTKSEVLSIAMSIFEPFGLLANVVIKAKIILQELWRTKIEWNMAIPEEIYQKWFEWYKEIETVKEFKVPRCYSLYFTNPLATVDLHIFVDASEAAFSAVAYWRICCDDEINIVFVAGKSRCSPIKALSIPRLELQAAVLGVRLKEAIITSHCVKPQEITYWSDSKMVIHWLRSDSRCYKQFVSHRVSEILETSEVHQWRWVPGS